MERTTFGMTFYIRRTKLDKTGKAPVFMRITVNGQRADASIKYHIPLRLWCTAKGRAVENSKEGKELNRLLDAISVNITQVRRQLESEGQEISASAVLLRYLGKDAPRRHSLIEVFKEHNEKCRALSGIDFSPTTVQRYDSLLRITQEFLNRQYGKTDFYLDELPERLVEDYEFYMKIQRKCAHNTVMKNLKNFKKIIRIAMTNGWLKKDPFREKHIHMEKVERAFLEKHKFLQVLNKQIDIPRIGQIRDIFCFCCYKGPGKTALLEHIRLTSPNYNCFVNDIPLSDFPYKSFAKIISGNSEQEAKLPLAWDWLLLVYTISSFTQDESIQTDMQEEWEETLNILRKLGIFPIKSVRDIVTQSAKRTFKINILSCFEFALEKNDQLIENDFIHIVSFLKRILESIHSDNRHYIIIDGLDEILTSREIQYQSIAALITQAKALNVYFKNAHIPIKIIVLCRTDIFERLPHPNKNKIRQDSAYVFDWFDESSVAEYTKCNLIQLANLRGKLAYPELTDIFAEFFPCKYENQPIYQALLEYTRHTPETFYSS